MPHYKKREFLIKILNRISGLHQMQIIDTDTKNKLTELTKQGKKDRYDGLYRYIKGLENQDEKLTEICDWILFE